MCEFYDSLETRSVEQREQELFQSIREHVAHAKENTVTYRQLLKDVEVEDLVDANSFSKLPITRKSELVEKQRITPPFGGMEAMQGAPLTHIFASPGPIYEPSILVQILQISQERFMRQASGRETFCITVFLIILALRAPWLKAEHTP